MSALKMETVLYGGGALVVAFIVYKLATKAGSIAANAKDANGNPVTAYQGAGAVGTAGAVANAASGGYLASLGEWFGSTAADVTDWFSPAFNPQDGTSSSTAAAMDKYTQGGNVSTGSGSLDMFSDPEGWGAQWGG